jgi:hypothetical protein
VADVAGSIGISGARSGERAVSGVRFDRAVIALSSWFLGGLYLDGWAHNHLAAELETFFTPWHAVFYSGFVAVAAVLVVAWYRGYRRGESWRRAVPAGYDLSLLGVPIFALGGVGDMVWHEFFGIETGVEPLLSPTHLMLALGLTLIVSGPLRAAWQRSEADTANGWPSMVPMLLSLTLTLSLFTFMTQFSHPFSHPWAAASRRASSVFFGQAMGVVGILLQTAVLMGFVLVVVRRWASLPLGALALVFGLNAALMSTQDDQYWVIPVAATAGVVADLLLRQLRPSVGRTGALRLFALVVPAVLYALYFLGLMLVDRVWWSIHLWAGSVVLASIVGLLLSYVLVPPALPGQPAPGIE